MRTSVWRAAAVGFNMEVEHNDRMRMCGYHGDFQRVPPTGYRVLRALHMTQMAVREHLALAIAPWLDPTSSDPRIEARLS